MDNKAALLQQFFEQKKFPSHANKSAATYTRTGINPNSDSKHQI